MHIIFFIREMQLYEYVSKKVLYPISIGVVRIIFIQLNILEAIVFFFTPEFLLKCIPKSWFTIH